MEKEEKEKQISRVMRSFSIFNSVSCEEIVDALLYKNEFHLIDIRSKALKIKKEKDRYQEIFDKGTEEEQLEALAQWKHYQP